LASNSAQYKELQSTVISGDDLFYGELPYIAVKAKEAWLTMSNDPDFSKTPDFALEKAQERADNFCEEKKFLHADDVQETDLTPFEKVEGWLLETPQDMLLIVEEKHVSQISWISMFSGSMAYRNPMVFNKIVCLGEASDQLVFAEMTR